MIVTINVAYVLMIGLGANFVFWYRVLAWDV